MTGDLIFQPMNFIHNLYYMGLGMLGVFMIIAIIMTSTYLISYFSNKKNDNNKDNK